MSIHLSKYIFIIYILSILLKNIYKICILNINYITIYKFSLGYFCIFHNKFIFNRISIDKVLYIYNIYIYIYIYIYVYIYICVCVCNTYFVCITSIFLNQTSLNFHIIFRRSRENNKIKNM